MSHTDTSLVCKDCSESFIFSAAQAKEFEEKGYENLPARCEKCRRSKLSSLRRRREGRVRAYTKPVPPSSKIVADGKTVTAGGVISFDGAAKSDGSAKNFGFIEYDGGHVYFALDTFKGPSDKLIVGTGVDFVCNKDEKERVQAISVTPNGKFTAPAPAAESAAAAPAAGNRSRRRGAADGEARESAPKKERAPAAPREPREPREDRPPREMIDINVTCAGMEKKVVQKPRERATFTIFRRMVVSAYGKGFDRQFQLFHKGEALTIASFNALAAGDTVEVRHGAPAAQA